MTPTMLSGIWSTNAGNSQTGGRWNSNIKGIYANPVCFISSCGPRINLELLKIQTDGADGIIAFLDFVCAISGSGDGSGVILISIKKYFVLLGTKIFKISIYLLSLHTVRNLHFLSKNSTLISRENCRSFWVKMSWFWTF